MTDRILKQAENTLRYAHGWEAADVTFLLREHKFSEQFLREVWHNWDSDICKCCKLSIDFIREFHKDPCFNWTDLMYNHGFYSEEEMEQFKKEFHLIQEKTQTKYSFTYIQTTNYYWHEDERYKSNNK